MDKFFILAGTIGIVCSIGALIGMAVAMGREGKWGMVIACLMSMSVVLFLTLVAVEYADEFWKGR